MEKKEGKRYLELQMEELKELHGEKSEDEKVQDEKKAASSKNIHKNPRNAAIAELYADAAEYEKDLEGFEKELEIINEYAFKDIPARLTRVLLDDERDYFQELKTVVEAGWTNNLESKETFTQEQLDLIKTKDFIEMVDALNSNFPDYKENFETDIRDILTQRWEMLINIKKEHIKEELNDIKISGLKPKYAKRVYKQYHGLS